jgi:phosphoglycerate dehydrogenase-like enzyme
VAQRANPVQAVVPFPDLIPQLPDGVIAQVFDGVGTPSSNMDEVEFYVPPYTFDRNPLKLIAGMPHIAVVQLLTAGYEHALSYIPAGVTLCKGGKVHDTSTAELAVTLMLAALRGIPDFVRAQDRHEWKHARRDSLADKKVLILGYGEIGAAIDRRLAGFEVNVRRVARRARDGVHPMSALPELLPDTDVVVVTVPLTDETRGLVDAEFLARLPDRALVVNVARGGVVDTEALLAELKTGRLRAALDVTDPEPPPQGHPLWTSPGLLLSPHVGGNTTAFDRRARQLIVDQLARYVAGQELRYRVA